MRRLGVLLITVIVMMGSFAACGANAPVEAEATFSPATQAPAPVTEAPSEPTAVPGTLILPRPEDGWKEAYLTFLDDNYDIFTALWPEGVSGMGFIDLDLDGTPELVVFDPGASVSLGAHIFDLIDGQVHCVSSASESAAGAFGREYLSPVSVCTTFFDMFRLSRTDNGWCFWVNSANGTMEAVWDEVVRFGTDENGVLTAQSVCYRYLESDPESGLVLTERYTVAGAEAGEADYEAASNVYLNGADVGYDARGVFLWNDQDTYEVPYEGFMAMARDAAAVYAPIADSITLASVEE